MATVASGYGVHLGIPSDGMSNLTNDGAALLWAGWDAEEPTPAMRQPRIPGELDHLNNYQVVTAEAKLNGQNLDARCSAIASMVGLSSQELVKLVAWWLGKLPASDVNRWTDREDVEERIYAKLLSNSKLRQTGDVDSRWEIAKLDIRCAYIDWYRNFRRQSNIGEYQAISLDRAAFQTGVDGESLADYVVENVDWLGEIDDHLFTDAVMVALPKPVAKVVAMRLTDTPTTSAERMRLKRFLSHKANVAGILGLLNGTISQKPVWIKGDAKA